MRLPRVALTAGLLASFLVLPLTAAADTYDYTYTETSTNPNIGINTFTYVYNGVTPIDSDTIFTPLTCSSTIPGDSACTTVEIDPTGLNQIVMNFVGGGDISTSGLPSTFFDVGDNSVGDGAYVMDIVDVTGISLTPEPSSLLLLATGLLGLTAILRRRLI